MRCLRSCWACAACAGSLRAHGSPAATQVSFVPQSSCTAHDVLYITMLSGQALIVCASASGVGPGLHHSLHHTPLPGRCACNLMPCTCIHAERLQPRRIVAENVPRCAGKGQSGTDALAEQRLRLLRSFRAAAAQLLNALLAHMLQGLHGPLLDPALLKIQVSFPSKKLVLSGLSFMGLRTPQCE